MKDEQFIAFHFWNSLRTAAQADLSSACCRFNVDMALAQLVADLSIPDLNRLALEVDLIILKPVVTAKQIETILGPMRGSNPNSARILARLAVGGG